MEPPFYNLTLPRSDCEEILYCLRRRAYDVEEQAAELGMGSRYGAILYLESMRISAIADQFESILPDPEHA